MIGQFWRFEIVSKEQNKGTVLVPVVQDSENEVFQNATHHTVGKAGELLASLKARIEGGLPTVPNEDSWNLRQRLMALLDEITIEAGRYRALTGVGDLVVDLAGGLGDPRKPVLTGKYRRESPPNEQGAIPKGS